MAELYEKPKLYANAPSGVESISGDPDLDKVLSELPPEEREEAMRRITAPPSGEEIANAMQEKNANGELFNMNLEQYRLLKAHNKNKEIDIISTFGQAAGGIYDELMKAAGSVANNPADALSKLTPSLIEAFSQGTRSLYGMAAQSVDPTSVMFRMKNALSANGSDEEAEYNQFMEAQRFNVHSMNLMSGKETLIMDKDVINHEMTQVMSYVADPTLFIPFGGIAMKGARLVGMGEGLAKASARASMIRNKVLGGTLKWGVGAPIEFLGNATRNTIDYGLERSASAFEFATGMPAAEAQATARMYGLNSVAGSLAGQTVPLPIVGNVTGALVGATTAQGIGEAVSMLGEQMIKQQKNGRGVLSYAGQAIRDSEKAGIKMSAHAKGLLRVIDMADPLFVYGMDIAEGAGTGMVIGGGLGYLSGGEEGMASGAGAGFALGSVGAGLGSVTADITNNRLYDRVAIQRKMVIEGLKGTDDIKATALEAYVASAEATGDRRYMAEVDGMIAGIDLMSPNSKWNIRTEVEHKAWLESLKIDPKTGRLVETTAILPQFGADRKSRASALSFLSMVSDNFSGLPENLLQHIDTLPADHAMKKHWGRLGDDVKKAILAEVKQSGDIEYRKAFGGKKSNQYYGDINYAEAHTARINSLFDSGNPTQARERINMLIKEETVGGKLTERGKALKDKLATEGYFDKDGKMRPSRLKDVEATEDIYRGAAGFVLRRDSTGQVEVNLNLTQMGKVTGLHELFHAIMLDSPMKDEFVDRLSTKLLGKFDANGKRIEGASVDTVQVKKFFQRYIDSLHRNNPEERANETTRLNRAVEEYEQRGDKNKVNRTTETTLEQLVEEFGAFYFPKFIQDKPVDYLFRGGELGAMREMFQSVKFGWLDFWRSKIGSGNPDLNFDAVEGNKLSQAFGKDGGNRYKNKALDLFMGDFVRATAMANRNGEFDLSRLSNEGQKTFIRNNGIRGYGTIDKEGKVNRLNRRTALREEMRVGKEIYKVVAGLDPKLRQGLTLDGEENFSGRMSPELADALVASGHVDRAWVDKLLRAYDIIDGKESNVIEFGYLGRTAQIGDYAWPRLIGSDVPFKNRTAILLDVDFKIGKDGRMSALYHTLDLAVIEGRSNAIWSDPAIRSLWDGSRTAMDADFFRYLSNASLPADHPNRVSSMKLLEDGTGKGAMRRNALHQMLGMAKLDGDVYINKPIAEIPLGIRHSVTTFNIDGVSGMRVRQGMRYDYNHANAFRDLSRNFMPSEMDTETTPNGKILKHGTGYRITKSAGSNRFSVFDVDGKEVGRFDTLADAGRAAQKDYNAKFDAKVEGKDLPVPRTEVPLSRQAYIDKEHSNALWQHLINKTDKDGLISAIDAWLNTYGKHYLEGRNYTQGDKNLIENTKLIESIKKGLEENSKTPPENLLHGLDTAIDGESTYGRRIWGNESSKVESIIRQQYDAMYPMEIKSALHGRLAQIMQDYPNLTAQGLLKKLDVYGSQGYRYLQEATEIGLVDLLQSKIKPRTEIYRKLDAQGNPTGEVVTREIPIERRHTGEVVGGTQPVLDMQEILDFAKSKEIKVTIEEGAREVNGMNTEQYTLGGDKSNYKETAIRINPEYAHGIRGHYGENTIVHFRTTVRLDAEGNKVLFIEEVQANNTDINSGRSQNDIVKLERDRRALPLLESIYQEGIKRGMYVSPSDTYTLNDNKQSAVRLFFADIEKQQAISSLRDLFLDNKEKLLSILDPRDITATALVIDMHFQNAIQDHYDFIKRNADAIHTHEGQIKSQATQESANYKFIVDQNNLLIERNKKNISNSEQEIQSSFENAILGEKVPSVDSKIPVMTEAILSIPELKKYFNDAKELALKQSEWENYLRNSKTNEVSGLGTYAMNPHHLEANISDIKTRIQQAKAVVTPLPLTSAKDWTLTSLKGIIRQAIRDGLDTITLTHPDDSPTVSHMAGDARRGLYGKLIPQIWSSWLKKYGIEMAQQNKLADANIDFHRNAMAEVSSKLSEANKKVLDRFEQIGASEDPKLISELSTLLAKPVHELTAGEIGHMRARIVMQLKDVQFMNLVDDALTLKSAENAKYVAIQQIREEGLRSRPVTTEDIKNNLRQSSGAAVSAEAIDRGMTFKLNDAIKQDFLSGNVKTHAMPTEGGMKGGRTYTPEQMKGIFIGRYADDNDRLVRNLDVDYELFSSGDQGRLLIKKLDGTEISAVTFDIVGKEAIVNFSSVGGKYQGKGIGNLAYSELIERFRSMGIEEVTGMIIDDRDRPLKIRRRIIDQENARVGGRPTDITGTRYDQDGSKQMDVTSYLEPKAWYMPAEGNNNKARYDIDEAILGKLKEKFKERGTKGLLTAKDMLEFIVENKGHMSPLAERLLLSLDKRGLEALVGQQTTVLGYNQKGAKGWKNSNYQPSANRINLILERNIEKRKRSNFDSYEELVMEEIVHALTMPKIPDPIAHASTIEATVKNVDSFLRKKEIYIKQFNKDFGLEMGFTEDWFTIAEAYKIAHKHFISGLNPDGSKIDIFQNHNVKYRLGDIAEFMVGVTQDKHLQRILAGVKIEKSQKPLLTKLFEAIKRIWGFDDSSMDSWLSKTSQATENIINRKQTDTDNTSGRYPLRSESYNSAKPKYMLAEGDRLIQNGFEKSDLNKKLLKSGHIVLGFDERELAGRAVVINNPDTMMTGELKTKEGKTLVEGEGGLNFVSKFADIWAKSNQSAAETTAKLLRKAQEENNGIAYLGLTRGDLTKPLTSHTGAKAGMSILEYFVDQGYISLEEFRNALKDSGKKYGIDFNATQSGRAIHAEIANKFFGVSDSSFKDRGNFVTDVITHLAEKGESGHTNIAKIRDALGSERLGRKISFAAKGIKEAIGLMISDKRANVDPSHIYAYIEVTGKISVENTENGHKSYPYHIVQRDAEGNKIRPRMLLPDKTNYVTDVMLDSNKEEVPRKYQVTTKEGKLQTKSGADKLGSNQVGEAYGYVKSADKIPEGKERLKWMPAEGWRDWQSERTSVGSVIKNTAGYLIMVQRDKFKVYNPYKAMIGIYDNEDQAKRRVQKDEPRR